jgi:hypothetical protein
MKKITLLFVVASMNLYSQVGGESIYSFLNLSGSAKQASLGGSIVTLMNDVNQPIWNPSVINDTMNNKLGVNYLNFLGDINYASASYAHMINERIGTFQTAVTYLNYGSFIGADEEGVEFGNFKAYDLSLSVGYSYNILESDFYIGANFKLINSVIANYSSFGLGTDIGFSYYSEHKSAMYTLVVRNIGYQITAYDAIKEDLPLQIILGASFEMEKVPIKWHFSINDIQQWDIAVSNPSNSTTDLDGNESEEDISTFNNSIRHLTIGAEFFPKSVFNIRLGYNFRRANEFKLADVRTFAGLSAGFGLNFDKFNFNYAFTKYHPVSNASTFSLQINLN